MPRAPRHDGLLEEVRRTRARRARARRDGERTVAESLALAGVLGWTVVLPTLLGILAGRWLDRQLEAGITFTAALLLAGACVGCWLAWARIRPP